MRVKVRSIFIGLTLEKRRIKGHYRLPSTMERGRTNCSLVLCHVLLHDVLINPRQDGRRRHVSSAS